MKNYVEVDCEPLGLRYDALESGMMFRCISGTAVYMKTDRGAYTGERSQVRTAVNLSTGGLSKFPSDRVVRPLACGQVVTLKVG